MDKIEELKKSINGKEAREPIARTLEKIASNFNNGQNTNQEVVEARGTHSTLNARLNVIESNIGDLSKLKTKNKSSIEGALNELAKKLGIVVVPPSPPDTWEDGVNLANARYGHHAFYIGNKLYVITGRNASGLVTSADEFNFTTKLWSTIATIEGRKQCACASVGNNIYIVDGNTDNGIINSTKILNVETKAIINGVTNPNANYGTCGVSYNGNIYIFCGEDAIENISNYTNVLNNTTNTWSYRKGINSKYACASAVGDKAYIFGGYDGTKNLNTVWVYDFATDTVSVLPNSMPTARRLATCAVIGKKIYVIGGYTNAPTGIVECFDTETGEWSTDCTHMTTARYDLDSCVANNKIYCIGGHDGTGATTKVEIYTPQ